MTLIMQFYSLQHWQSQLTPVKNSHVTLKCNLNVDHLVNQI